MRKIILSMLLIFTFSNAGKIYLGYEFNMDKKDIPNLIQIKDEIDFPEPFKVYKDENGQIFIFKNNKLKAVKIIITKINLKKNIEENIKNGFRLKKILVRNKYGQKKVNNVKELLEFVDKAKEEAELFDSFIVANLAFENDKNSILMTYKLYMKRNVSKCIQCDFVKGKEARDYELLSYLFTQKGE